MTTLPTTSAAYSRRITGHPDQKAEELLGSAATKIDPARRKEISDDLQLNSMQQYWRFPLYWEQKAAAFWPDVGGCYHHPQPSSSFVCWERMGMDPNMKDGGGYSGQTSGVPSGL